MFDAPVGEIGGIVVWWQEVEGFDWRLEIVVMSLVLDYEIFRQYALGEVTSQVISLNPYEGAFAYTNSFRASPIAGYFIDQSSFLAHKTVDRCEDANWCSSQSVFPSQISRNHLKQVPENEIFQHKQNSVYWSNPALFGERPGTSGFQVDVHEPNLVFYPNCFSSKHSKTV